MGNPSDICILRLSSLGDVCHTLPVVRRVQDSWPKVRIAWIIGENEARLLEGIDGVRLVAFPKKHGISAFKELYPTLRKVRFDILLHMQLSMRASLVSTLVRAERRVGFDPARSKELQHLFVNEHISSNQTHVMDVLLGFAEAIGIQSTNFRWDIPIPDDAAEYAEQVIQDSPRTLVISPCSSHPLRNWSAPHYAAVADHAVRHHNMKVVLCGGPSRIEKEMGASILGHMKQTAVNMIAKDNLKKLLALIARADLLLSPDSGPVHMATAVDTAVLGLYAATSSERSGPYWSRRWCVDRFADASLKFLNRPAKSLKWGTKIEVPGVMDLIRPAEVIERLDAFWQAQAAMKKV
jgi:heptosyltransferase I